MRNIPDWDTYFLNIAKVVSTRSKDIKTQVGCIIVDPNNHIIGTGYNGLISGVFETEEMWEDENKHNFVIHAETNAVANATTSVRGSTLYCTLFPCTNCAKLIAAAGIRRLVYIEDKTINDISMELLYNVICDQRSY